MERGAGGGSWGVGFCSIVEPEQSEDIFFYNIIDSEI